MWTVKKTTNHIIRTMYITIILKCYSLAYGDNDYGCQRNYSSKKAHDEYNAADRFFHTSMMGALHWGIIQFFGLLVSNLYTLLNDQNRFLYSSVSLNFSHNWKGCDGIIIIWMKCYIWMNTKIFRFPFRNKKHWKNQTKYCMLLSSTTPVNFI